MTGRSARYRAALVGCGPRGRRHALGLLASPRRFDLVAVCDRDADRLAALAGELGVARRYTDAERMLRAESPAVLCFATPPAIRWELVELAIGHGVRAIALEKPLALCLADAERIVAACAAAGVLGVVCHQLRHGAPWRRAKAIAASGGLGDVRAVLATGRPSMLRVGTHLVDAMLWLAGAAGARWVVGRAAGKAAYGEDHPGPDHLGGVLELDTGALGSIQVGALAPRHLDEARFWEDATVTVVGSAGHMRVVLGAGWEATMAGGRVETGPPDPSPQEGAHLALLADWLDDGRRVHPCDLARSRHGLEVLLGMALSHVEGRRVDLPLTPAPAKILDRLRDVLPDDPPRP